MKLFALFTAIIMAVRSLAAYYAPTFRPEKAEIEHVLTIEAPTESVNTVQGATYDGENYYVAFIDATAEYQTAIIIRTDSEGNELMRSEPLPVDHANSITLLEDGNLMVAHCDSPDGHYFRYSVIDKDTLEIISTADLDEPFMSMAYSEENECYVGGEWSGYKINVYSDDLTLARSFYVDFIDDSVPQSYYLTKNEIYSIRCVLEEDVFINYLYVYSYSGEMLLEYEMEMPDSCEAEAVSVTDGDVYVICGDSGRCEVYRIANLKSRGR